MTSNKFSFSAWNDELLKLIKEGHEFTNSINTAIINLEQDKFDKLIQDKLKKCLIENENKKNPESEETITRDLRKNIVDCLFSLVTSPNFNKNNVELYMDIISSQVRPELLLITLWSQKETEIVYSVLEKKSYPIESKLVDAFYDLFTTKIDTYKADMPIGTKEREDYIANLKNELILASRFLALKNDLDNTMKNGDLKDRRPSKV